MNELVALLGDRDADVRRAAINAVASNSGGNDPPKALVHALKDESAGNRSAVIRGLTEFRQGLDPWVPLLLGLAEQDPASSVREDCITTLGSAFRRGAITAAAVPHLIASLKSGDVKVRSHAAFLLGEFKADAEAAIPELLRILIEPMAPGVVGVGPIVGPDMTLDPACAAAWRSAGSRRVSRCEVRDRGLAGSRAFGPGQQAWFGRLCPG